MIRLTFLLVLCPFAASAFTIVDMIDSPSNASGLAWDGSALWCGAFGVNGDTLYKINPTNGTILRKLSVTSDTSYTQGIAFVSSQIMWTLSRSDFNFDFYTVDTATGSRTYQFTAPQDYVAGLAYDGGYFWFCAYSSPDNRIYKSTTGGAFVDTLTFAGAPQMWGAAWDGTYLWVSNDGNYGGSHAAYKLDVSGPTPVLVDSVKDGFTRPMGLAWDGTYLWIAARVGGVFKLLKVDVSGGGTPAITLPASHDFGVVTVGVGASWNCNVQSTGTDTLVVDSVRFTLPEYTTATAFPLVMPNGSATNVAVDFDPAAFDTFGALMIFYSNDPLHSIDSVNLTGIGVYPTAHVLTDPSHAFGSVRVGLDKMWRLGVWNVGATPLVVDSLTFGHAWFHDEMSVFPTTIATLDSASFDAWCSPDGSGPVNSALSIHGNAGVNQVSLSATGDASAYPPGTVLWTWQGPTATFMGVKGGAAIANVDWDGEPDVVVTTEGYKTAAIHGSSSGDGAELWAFWTNTNPLRTGSVWNEQGFKNAGDLDADGFDDVVMGTTGGSRTVFALDGRTGDTLWTFDTHAIGEGGWVYEVGPIDNTVGAPGIDVIAGAGDDQYNAGPKRLFVFDGPDGTPRWEYLPPHPANESTVYRCRAVPDVNGDGFDEIAIGYGDATPYNVSLINGQTHAAIWTNPMTWAIWSVVPVPDVNGNGADEVVAGDMAGVVRMWDGATGAQLWSTTIGSYMVNNIEVIGDADGDGHPDLAVGSTQSNCLIRSSATGAAIWAAPTGGQTNVVARVGDLNGDGEDDVLAGGEGNAVYVFSCVGGWQMWASTPTADEVNVLVAVPSVDGDPYDDILAGDDAGRAYLISTSGGTLVPGEEAVLPSTLALHAYPNPFNPATTISFDLPSASHVRLEVYNVLGQRVATLLDERMSAGRHEVRWDASAMASGVYFARIVADQDSATRKVVLLK